MSRKEIAAGDLLYHGVHGLCRIDKVIKGSGADKKSLQYSLVPKVPNKMKMRFIIGGDDIEASGFHTVISLKEANRILEYFKNGDHKEVFIGKNETWDLAQALLSLSHDHPEAKDQRKRQLLERSIKGLLGELAFVLKMTLPETAMQIRKNLEASSKINPLVVTALVNAAEE